MRLTVTTFLTLDGVMQGPGGPDEDRDGGFELGGWLVPYVPDSDEEFGGFMTGIFEQAEAFLLGRRTYDIFAGFWPAAGDSDPVAAALNALPKHVASRTSPDLTWQGASVLDGDLVEAVTELKTRPGKELQVHGSANLLQTLSANDLVDTYRLVVAPVVLGTGKRLFEGGAAPRAFRLADHKTTATGVQLLAYERAGVVETGTVGS